jgi:ABC-type branched-subunit amino acid transport system substrate-binding protein
VTIRIGILFDVDQPDIGASRSRLAELGLEEVRRTGRLPDEEVEFVPEVAEGGPHPSSEALASAFGRLADAGVLGIIGPAVADGARVVTPLADKSRLPCINWAGSEHARSEFMFQYQVGSHEEEPYVLAEHLAAEGLRNIVLAHEDSLIGRAYTEFFMDAHARAGLRIVGSFTVGPGGEGADAVETNGADAVVYLGFLSAHALARSLAERGSPVPAFANTALMFGYMSPELARAWEGWTYVDVWSEDNPIFAALRRRVQGLDEMPAAAAMYDMVRLVAEGLARAPERTREGLREGLERVKFLPAVLGAAGTWMGFGRWDRAALKGRYLLMRTWREGRSVPASLSAPPRTLK